MVIETIGPEEAGTRVATTFTSGIAALRERAVPPPSVPKIRSQHPPYQQRKCLECHDMTTNESMDTARDASLCDRCHYDQRKEEGWDHGPINLGVCIPCHVPHASIHPSLLSEAVPKLCVDCHLEVAPEKAEYHDVPNFFNCVDCHDPHRMY